jgi:predicted nucleic acid-binding protein
MTRQYYYLDTNYILAYLAYKHPEHFKNLDINPTESRLANSVIGYLTPKKIKIPVFVLAELVTQLKEKNVYVGIDVLIGDFEIAMIRKEDLKKFVKALKILTKDERLEVMDRLIVAHAISSYECTGFLTFENRLITSRSIKNANEDINGSEGIVITSDPRSK